MMKFFAILSLLALTLVKESLSTHLETCNCDEIKQLVNTTVQEAVAGLEKRLGLIIDSAIYNINTTNNNTALENLDNKLTDLKRNFFNPCSDNLTTIISLC